MQTHADHRTDEISKADAFILHCEDRARKWLHQVLRFNGGTFVEQENGGLASQGSIYTK